MLNFLPWQTADAVRLLNEPNQLAHALLLHGLAGSGKHEFALALAGALLCENRQLQGACGQCESCLLMLSGNHPDFARVRPEAQAALEGDASGTDDAADAAVGDAGTGGKRKLSEELKVEQIRALEPWYHRATHRGGWRIVVLYPAEALSIISANALLKSLEEPPPNTLFLLTSDAPDRLLPTIVSRCQKFALGLPDWQQSTAWLTAQGVQDAAKWLAASGGAPLAALAASQSMDDACPKWAQTLMSQLGSAQSIDVAMLADTLAKGPSATWLSVLQRMAHDLMLKAGGLPARYYPDLAAATPAPLANKLNLDRIVELSHWLNQQMRLARHPLNAKLFSQACVQHFCDAVS